MHAVGTFANSAQQLNPIEQTFRKLLKSDCSLVTFLKQPTGRTNSSIKLENTIMCSNRACAFFTFCTGSAKK